MYIIKKSNAELEREFIIKDDPLVMDESEESEHKKEYQRIK